MCAARAVRSNELGDQKLGQKDFSRTDRIAEQLRRELSTLIIRRMNDPRLERVSISAVEVSKDLAHAKVFVTAEDIERAQTAVTVLTRARGYLKRHLAEQLVLRTLPSLKFVHDASLERAMQVSRLIDTAIAEDESKHGQD